MKVMIIRTIILVILLLGAWPKTGSAEVATASAVGVWANFDDPTTVPVAARSGVTAVAVGNRHTVVLKHDGSVVAWGWDDFGQVTGTSGIDYPYPPLATANPVTLAGKVLTGVTAIAAGFIHTVALKNDGSVVAWGSNLYGETAVPANARRGVTAIAAGWNHTAALKSDGSVVAWGAGSVNNPGNNHRDFNDHGQSMVPEVAQSGVIAIAAGGSHTVALRNDGSVVAWGAGVYHGFFNEHGQSIVPPAAQREVVAIAAGGGHTVVLKHDGSVVAWGDNAQGQTSVPQSARSGVIAIAAGSEYTAALKNDGSVVTWGNTCCELPASVQGRVTAIAAGGNSALVLAIPTAPAITTPPTSQTVNVWHDASLGVTAEGYPLYYQWRKDGVDLAGERSATYNLTFAQTVDAGSYTVVVSNPAGSMTSAPPAVLTVIAPAHGSVLAWGDNPHGETTVPLAAQSGVAAIAAGRPPSPSHSGHVVALKNDGSVVAWGSNDHGQVTGTPTTNWPPSATASPVTLGGRALSDVAAVAAGPYHTVALKRDGSLAAWGYNLAGQVSGISANGSSDSAIANPVTLEGKLLTGVVAIAAGAVHTVALKEDGSVAAWGSNESGQVTGTPTADWPGFATANPVTLAGQPLTGVSAIAAGSSHTLALKKDGSVVAWGNNASGQTTVPVAAQSEVTAIAAGGNPAFSPKSFSVALKRDGSVVVWGDNGLGVTDVPVAARSGVTAIAAGSSHILALKNNGTVVVWGYSEWGQTSPPSGLSGVTGIAGGGDFSVVLLGTAPALLHIRRTGDELVLSWPGYATGVSLQSTSDLAPTPTWRDVAIPPAMLGSQWMVKDTLSGSERFYRLLTR